MAQLVAYELVNPATEIQTLARDNNLFLIKKNNSLGRANDYEQILLIAAISSPFPM